MQPISRLVLCASCWSSDVFCVAMTMVTIVRQSISNVEAGALAAAARESESRREHIWTHSSFSPTLEFDSGGSEAAGQEGRKQVCMCV